MSPNRLSSGFLLSFCKSPKTELSLEGIKELVPSRFPTFGSQSPWDNHPHLGGKYRDLFTCPLLKGPQGWPTSTAACVGRPLGRPEIGFIPTGWEEVRTGRRGTGVQLLYVEWLLYAQGVGLLRGDSELCM